MERAAMRPRADSPYPEMKNPKGYLNIPYYSEWVDSPVDPALELTDPFPDIQRLFAQFNQRFFEGRIRGVEVKWSSKMTRKRGLCTYNGPNGSCCIKLSKPLQKPLMRRHLVETLLHEMIHAYLYVCKGETPAGKKEHGPSFYKLMRRINRMAGTTITVPYRFYKKPCYQHWYRCDGPCAQWRPCLNSKRHRHCPPWPVDENWQRHRDTCGGTFRKQRGAQGPAERSKQEREPGDNKSQ